MTPEHVRHRVAEIARHGPSSPVVARDPVNLAMINNWVEAIGDTNAVYVDEAVARAAGHDGLVAPPAMLQVWTMRGLHAPHPPDDPLAQTMQLLDEAGYPAVVATNCEQTYHRYIRHGERLAMVTSLVDVVGPKRTALGEGWFMTTHHVWYSGDEPVGDMRFRMLKYAPARGSTPPPAHDDRAAPCEATALDAGASHLPVMTVEATPTFIIASALATRDFQDVHHDRDRARSYGARDIFVNILTDTGLVQRFVTDWSGPSTRLHGISLRLLAPCYAYDMLVFTGTSSACGAETTVSVTARGKRRTHLVATVRLSTR